MKTFFRTVGRLLNADTFSPKAFVVRAVLVTMCYAISRLCGLQEYTTFLTGTNASDHLRWETSAVLGMIHLLLHVAFILFVPISLIAAVLLAGWNRRRLLSQRQAP